MIGARKKKRLKRRQLIGLIGMGIGAGAVYGWAKTHSTAFLGNPALTNPVPPNPASTTALLPPSIKTPSSRQPLALIASSRFLLWPGSKVGAFSELPARLEGIYQRLEQDPDLRAIARIEPIAAPVSAIERVHSSAYVRFIQNHARGIPAERLLGLTASPAPKSTQTAVPSSITPFDAAALAAGAAIQAVDLVIQEPYQAAFSLGRPPGHHSNQTRTRGFCIFNNAAIAARYAQQTYQLKRIAIVDWDVHHGNGTQEIFYPDPSVLYLSVHQQGIYPKTGAITESGSGRGRGYTVNAPLLSHTGDQMYLAVFERLFDPILRSFQPDLIIVSAGQDAHVSERVSQMNLTAQGYRQLTSQVMTWADQFSQGRLVLLLEGGYIPTVAGIATHEILRTLAGLLPAEHDIGIPDPGLKGKYGIRLDKLLKYHRQFWPAIQVSPKNSN